LQSSKPGIWKISPACRCEDDASPSCVIAKFSLRTDESSSKAKTAPEGPRIRTLCTKAPEFVTTRQQIRCPKQQLIAWGSGIIVQYGNSLHRKRSYPSNRRPTAWQSRGLLSGAADANSVHDYLGPAVVLPIAMGGFLTRELRHPWQRTPSARAWSASCPLPRW